VDKPSRGERITVTSAGEAQESSQQLNPGALLGKLQQLPVSAKWTLQHLQIQGNGEEIAEAIASKKARAACDGSLKVGVGTAAFVLKTGEGTERMKGVNKVTGPIKDGDSHRCEVSGMYAVILTAKEICKMHGVKAGGVTVLCDSMTALRILETQK
jgi:hypothetical protein